MEVPEDPDDLARQCAKTMYARDRASQAMGFRLRETHPGRAIMEMEISASMANGGGICHGGYIFSLADTAMAFASNSRNDAYVGVSASIEFLSPGRVGETLVAVATEEHRAGRTATYRVAVTDSNYEPIAQFLGRTYRVRGTVLNGPA